MSQLQVSFLTFQMPVSTQESVVACDSAASSDCLCLQIGFPLALANISRYFSGIVSFDIGQLVSPECSVDQSQGIVYMASTQAIIPLLVSDTSSLTNCL